MAESGNQAGEETQAGGGPSVSSIILNYNAPLEKMLKCLGSLAAQTYGNHRILLVDNASDVDILAEVATRHPEIEILRLDRNFGFSGGVNRGIARSGSDYVFLLNFDTIVAPEAVAELVKVAAADDDIVGVAPKILFADHPHIFDSVGICMGDDAGAFNQGIGQPDIGQYDITEQVFGACFGAALIRREAFEPERVGPLDEDYFMYFEDVDWCFRAGLLGYRFLTAPAAVVYHEHSASVRGQSYNFKYRLIQLNLLRTVLKNYQRRLAVRITARRLRSHLTQSLSPRSPWRPASRAVVGGFIRELPGMLSRRRQVQGRRQVRDIELLKLAYGELPYYDPTAYEPFYTLDNLIAAYRRRHIVCGDEKALDIWKGLEALNQSKLRFDPALLEVRLKEILAGQPDHVLEFAARVRAS